MQPEHFGRGSWYFIFTLFYYIQERTQIQIREHPENESKIILNSLEILKKRINLIIDSLPCEECKTHAMANLKDNAIYESTSFFYIFHFFIELRNGFYKNKLNRSSYNDVNDMFNNKETFFTTLLSS